MSFFSTGVTRDKLCIMYFLGIIEIDITRIQLTTVFLENDWVPYFDAMTAIAELEEDGFIAAVPRAFGQCYHLTDLGKETLSLFQDSIPASIREEYDDYVERNRENLREQPRFETYAEKLPSGAINMKLRILEKHRALLELSFCVPDAKSASHVEKIWRDKAEEIYKLVYTKLVLDD